MTYRVSPSDSSRHASSGVLWLAAAPLGNPDDASVRLRQVLAEADWVLAEDTRRTRRLANDMSVTISGTVTSFHEHNEHARAGQVASAVMDGQTVVLITDAGTPSISDPGFRAVDAVLDAGGHVSVLPGPSAVTAALAVSGVACDRFSFEGFVPRKHGARHSYLERAASYDGSLVFFESPRRVAVTLTAMADMFGASRRAAVCRELSKTYEEIIRGTLSEVTTWAHTTDVLGEITIVVGPPEPAPTMEIADLVDEVATRVNNGKRMKDATREVAKEHNVSSRELYAAVIDNNGN